MLISFFCMQSFNVTLFLTCTARSSYQAVTFEIKPRCLMQIQLPQWIAAAGEEVLENLYSGKQGEKLDSLCYKYFCEKVATNVSHLHPQTLPPTSAAAKYHSLCVYLQVQEWKGYELNPLEWAGKSVKEDSCQCTLTLPPIPDELLKVIRCNCHTDCSTLRCTCQKYK